MTTPAVPVLSKADAKRLTRRIKTTGEVLWALLAEAHEGQAWKVLEYPSWKTYCEAEFGMNERTAFRVLDQGKVAKALTAAANEPVEVSQRQAAAVKPHLPEAVERIEAGEAPAQVVGQLAKPAPSDVAPQDPPADVPVEPTAETEGDGRRADEEAHLPPAPSAAQDPAPREAGEEVAGIPLSATSDPVKPRPKSGGEGAALRASSGPLSTGPSTMTPIAMVKALLARTANEWEGIPAGLVGQLSSKCRQRLGADAPSPDGPVYMKAAAKAESRKSKASSESEHCRHPVTRRIGEKRDFCGACSRKVT